ncbi:hypothetical protein HLH33_13720 [Gluconacetobacter diazotrophicus]|uniref:Uncharacterized protein n=1 Tax=Gluconacetobacter diazotrophicus TaxID=33996 RepID=A0A7W4I717_GLUDI|nr:hypothetical protein [Gluconacetobacter diazotrophicus]
MLSGSRTGSIQPDAPRPSILSKDCLRPFIEAALAYQATAFDEDEPIDGGDLLEWFALWRVAAREALVAMDNAGRRTAQSQEQCQ